MLRLQAPCCAGLLVSAVNWLMPYPTTWWDDLDFVDPPVLDFVADARLGELPGLHSAIAYVHSLIREQIRLGQSADRIFVAGWSQGGFLALRAALSFPDAPLGGAFCVSTFLGGFEPTIARAQHKLQVLLAHGTADRGLPIEGARSDAARLHAWLPEGRVRLQELRDVDHTVRMYWQFYSDSSELTSAVDDFLAARRAASHRRNARVRKILERWRAGMSAGVL